jgi:hypothetical protein
LQQSSRRAGQTALLLDGSGSEKLGGALKDATRVTPNRNREFHRQVGFTTQFTGDGQAQTEPPPTKLSWEAQNFTAQSNEGDAAKPSRPYFLFLHTQATHLPCRSAKLQFTASWNPFLPVTVPFVRPSMWGQEDAQSGRRIEISFSQNE